MLKTVFMIGLFAVVGLFVLKIAFGIFLGLFGVLLSLAIKIAIVGGIVYLVIRLVSPETAAKMKDRWSSNSSL
ncbi:MAG TPA: hypothetical protein VNA89_12215 [Gemmatimonadaceae bacterium]|nr:hypothetical protein [Gemmatimonadaceae bacterium]